VLMAALERLLARRGFPDAWRRSHTSLLKGHSRRPVSKAPSRSLESVALVPSLFVNNRRWLVPSSQHRRAGGSLRRRGPFSGFAEFHGAFTAYLKKKRVGLSLLARSSCSPCPAFRRRPSRSYAMLRSYGQPRGTIARRRPRIGMPRNARRRRREWPGPRRPATCPSDGLPGPVVCGRGCASFSAGRKLRFASRGARRDWKQALLYSRCRTHRARGLVQSSRVAASVLGARRMTSSGSQRPGIDELAGGRALLPRCAKDGGCAPSRAMTEEYCRHTAQSARAGRRRTLDVC
jgi:hypothetical protein